MEEDLDFGALDRFASTDDVTPAVRKGKGTRKNWTQPTLDEFAHGSVVAWDQSTTATGWVWLVSDQSGLWIRDAGSFSGEHGSEGWENVLRSAQMIELKASGVMMRVYSRSPDAVCVHEAPPTGGGKFLKPELSLVCAYAIRHAAYSSGLSVKPMVTPQNHKTLICGNHIAKKPVEHAALKELSVVLPIVGYTENITNEAKRDALCVALSHLLREGPHGNS